MSKARPSSVVAARWLGLALVAVLVPLPHRAPAGAPPSDAKAAVVTRSLPAPSGVRSEARTVLPASADKVASLLSDPRNFAPLFPAHAVEVRSHEGDTQVVAVEMRKPWPVGTVKWVEDVVTSREADGKTILVSRSARPGYFKSMTARWRVTPDPQAETERCIVTYEVSMELARWVPEWMLRRGNLSGIQDTMSRLRSLVAQASTEAKLPAPGQRAAAATSVSYQ